MIIAGIDSSYASPAVVWAELDNKTLDVIWKKYIGFTSVKKFTSEDVYCYEKSKQESDKDNIISRYVMFVSVISEALKMDNEEINYVSFEDYAFGAPGQLTKLAETVGSIKVLFYNHGSNLRLYEIGNIKRFATGIGNADKFMMEDSYEKIPTNEKFDLRHLPLVKDKKTGNPKDNIVDAYFIMKFLQTELKIRKGIISLQDLPEHQIKCFNLVTKANPLNLPVRPFIHKEI